MREPREVVNAGTGPESWGFIDDAEEGWDTYPSEDDINEEYASTPGGVAHIANIRGHSYESMIRRLLVHHTGSPEKYLDSDEEQRLATAIQLGLAAQAELQQLNDTLRPADLRKANMRTTVAKLEQQIQAGKLAENKLIECSLKIATYTARLSMNILPGSDDDEPGGQDRFRHKHLRSDYLPDITRSRSRYAVYDDRVQIANEALIRAVRSFKPGKTKADGELVTFMNHAIPIVRGEVLRLAPRYEMPGAYIPPDKVRELNLDNPKDLDLLNSREVVPLDSLVLKGAADEELSEDEDDGESALLLAEILADIDDLNPETAGIMNDRDELLASIINTLSERQAGVLRMRAGMGTDHPMTYDEIGWVYGVTRERVRQILHKVKELLTETGPQRRAVQQLQEYLGIDDGEFPPAHTAVGPRVHTGRVIGSNALQFAANGEYVNGISAPRSSSKLWGANGEDDWDDQERDRQITGRLKGLIESSLYPYQWSFTRLARTLYPKVMVERINAELGTALSANHIAQLWNTQLPDIMQHFEHELGDDFNADRVTQLFSRLLAERMNDNQVVELTIPEGYGGRLNYIGAGLERGKLIVYGNAGTHVGHRATGLALIQVQGSAGDSAGSEAKGDSHLEINGDAGWFVGAKASGRASIEVMGSVGDHCGHQVKSDSVYIRIHGNAGKALADQATDGIFEVLGTAVSVRHTPRFRGQVIVGNNS